jgi:hypothetical protein
MDSPGSLGLFCALEFYGVLVFGSNKVTHHGFF